MEDMSVISTDENMLTLVYSSKSHLGKQVLGYVQGAGDALRTIDIAETKLGHAVWVTLADGLGKDLGELFSLDNTETLDIEDSDSFDTDDWLKLIDNNPELLQNPIAIKGKKFMQVTSRSEVLKFFEVDSAGLEKKNMGEEPVTKSTTKDESFI
ncbi:MAG: hypothetical protein CML05_08465 [Pseudozobellia sp.]|nr:hypothetical protein [Pseudozobellia sp.]|tara:strand:+ start:70 stop:531 length:462 start_codon:yes stop_codon:yes gene_type:complete